MRKLQTALDEAEADLQAALKRRGEIAAELKEAEAWVNEALRRTQEARFELRAAAIIADKRATDE